MSALLGGLVFILAAWGFIDVVRRIGRGLAAAARFLWASIQATAYRIGGWVRRTGVASARVKDFKDNGMARLQVEVIAMQVNQIAEMRAELKALKEASSGVR